MHKGNLNLFLKDKHARNTLDRPALKFNNE
jgi:hypothetical protein